MKGNRDINAETIEIIKYLKSYLKLMIQSGQRLDKNVRTFVLEFVPTGNEKVQCFIQIEIVVPVSTVEWNMISLPKN